MSTERLLVPLDGSDAAAEALPYATKLALATGAALVLLGVVEIDGDGALAPDPQTLATLVEMRTAELRGALEAAAAGLRDQNLQVETALAEGVAANAILTEAERIGTTTIIMATHGSGGVARWLVGSVADKVMRASTRPVLLIPPGSAEASTVSHELRRFMTPLDGSAMAETALDLAARLSQATGGTWDLVRVEPWQPSPGSGGEFIPDFAFADHTVLAAAGAYLAATRAKLPATLQVRTAALRGSPVAELCAYVQREDIDLVVMATHGYGGVRRLILGSTADGLVRSHLPVLLVPPAAQTGSSHVVEEGARAHRSLAS